MATRVLAVSRATAGFLGRQGTAVLQGLVASRVSVATRDLQGLVDIAASQASRAIQGLAGWMESPLPVVTVASAE